jgi:L-cysteine desulfidase
MSGIFDIIPLIISGLSLLSSLEGEGLNKKAGKHILRNVEDIIKRLTPYQQELLRKKLELLELR